jgi:hypothetical protein
MFKTLVGGISCLDVLVLPGDFAVLKYLAFFVSKASHAFGPKLVPLLLPLKWSRC